MAFKQGQSGNPKGGQLSSPGRRTVNKMQKALEQAIDALSIKNPEGMLASEMADIIVESMRKNPIGTLKAIAPLLPKDVNIDVTRRSEPVDLSDEDLAELVAERARSRREAEQVIEGEIEDMTGTDG